MGNPNLLYERSLGKHGKQNPSDEKEIKIKEDMIKRKEKRLQHVAYDTNKTRRPQVKPTVKKGEF